jgi:hypothetical protein
MAAPRATDDYEDRVKMIITTELAREKVTLDIVDSHSWICKGTCTVQSRFLHLFISIFHGHDCLLSSSKRGFLKLFA